MFFFIADKTCGLGNWDEDVVGKETEDKMPGERRARTSGSCSGGILGSEWSWEGCGKRRLVSKNKLKWKKMVGV